MHLFLIYYFHSFPAILRNDFVLKDDVRNVVFTTTFRLDHKYNIRDKMHILGSYLNSLWCFDGINEKEYEYTTLQTKVYLRSLQRGYIQLYNPKILKKEKKISDLKSSIGLCQNGLDWKTIRNIRSRFA